MSFCADKVQMLKCDGQISATVRIKKINKKIQKYDILKKIFLCHFQTGANFVEYDSVSCTNGLWSGTGCDGLPQVTYHTINGIIHGMSTICQYSPTPEISL